jgi:MFS family permease
MKKHGLGRVIVASSVGTVIEFYDFFIFASLAATIAAHFFPSDRPTFGFLSTLATYGIGLAVRPFGSLAFGRLGDTVGRKTTFLITLLMMGTATAAIGLLPGYARIGAAAPILLITLRVVQGSRWAANTRAPRRTWRSTHRNTGVAITRASFN